MQGLNQHTIFVLLALLLLAPSHAVGYSQEDIYRLYDFLFEENVTRYKPEVRPSNEGKATYVFIDVLLLSISSLDEKAQQLEASIIVDARWRDAYLSWNASEYGNITELLVPQEKIWLPDLVIENSVERQRQLGYDENKVIIAETGMIFWKPGVIVKSDCDIDVTFYPFDTQTCSIIISTWMSDKDEINVEPDTDTNGMILDYYSESGTWEVVNNTLKLLPDLGETTRIQFTVTLKRLRTYYVLNIILPMIFLSFTASMVFFLPADAGEKTGMSITVLLAYAVYLTIIADNMPQTSLHVSYLAIYLTVLLGVTALGVVLAVVVLHLHHKPEENEIGHNIKELTRAIRRALCIRRQPTNTKRRERLHLDRRGVNLPPPDYEKEVITWPKVAETLDRLLFSILTLIIAIVTIAFLLSLALGQD